MKGTLFVLGAPDPEMAEIEKLLDECNIAHQYATVDGVRTHAGNAYKADPIDDTAELDFLVFVECGWEDIEDVYGRYIYTLDHHSEGDPGYSMPAAEYMRGSSIGQAIEWISAYEELPDSWVVGTTGMCEGNPHEIRTGKNGGSSMIYTHERDVYSYHTVEEYSWYRSRIPHELQLVAAADHCLQAAYRGECPGVTPTELAEWRAKGRAAFQRRPVQEVLDDIERAKTALMSATLINGVADMRPAGFVPELPEAACQLGIPFLASLDSHGRTKVILQAAGSDLIEQFLAGELVELVDYYGNPTRGFAGGYVA